MTNATLRTRIDVHASLAIFRISPNEGPLPPFEPGQFINLGLPGSGSGEGQLLQRAFSIASSPRERWHVELYLRRIDNGEFTPLLWGLEPGARLWLDPRVHGFFTLQDVPRENDLLLVATGTGLAPFVSMIRTYRGRSRWSRCVLIEGARTAEDLGYRSELERTAAADPSILYLPTLTREPESSGWRGLRGRVQNFLEPEQFEQLTGMPLDPGRWQVFLCGNPSMIVEATALLAGLGFRPHRRTEPGQIHTERYE